MTALMNQFLDQCKQAESKQKRESKKREIFTEAIDGGHARELGIADVLRDAEAADGETSDDVVFEVEQGVALGPMEDWEDVGYGGEEALLRSLLA